MKRREFIIGAVTAACTDYVRAQKPAVPVIGYLNPGSPPTAVVPSAFALGTVFAFAQGLKDTGFTENQNVTIAYRWAEEHNDRLPVLAADLVRQQVAVIMAAGTAAALVAKSATTSIPIVFQLGNDPIKAGLVASLNRPGGNVTGVTNTTVGLAAKRLGLLHDLVPNATTIAIIGDPTSGTFEDQTTELQEAARTLGLTLILLNASSEQQIDAAFETLSKRHAGALLLTDTPLFNSRREQLVELAAHYGVPTIYTFRQFAVTGGLISYASSITDANRRAGVYVARILRGEKPGDLPVEQPTKFELIVNLKTAKTLGITVPAGILSIADEVIE
jgi:putative tryptophan/tyrosine transport system substrate-binding protein